MGWALIIMGGVYSYHKELNDVTKRMRNWLAESKREIFIN